jgi:hypothetical protein
MKPNRLGAPVRGAAYNTKFRRPDRAPERTICVNSAAVRTLLIRASNYGAWVQLLPVCGMVSRPWPRRTVLSGPCCDALPGLHVRRVCACEGGSHACGHDGGYSAEKSACSRYYSKTILRCARPITTKRRKNRLTRQFCMPTGLAAVTGAGSLGARYRSRPAKVGMKDYTTLGDARRHRQTEEPVESHITLREPVDNSFHETSHGNCPGRL